MDNISNATFVDHAAIQSVVDGVDEVARQQESKWGVGRLELLVSNELRTKFRRQLQRFNDAIASNDLEKVQTTGEATKRGWLILDQAAAAAGAVPLSPEYWEFQLSDGSVVAFCRNGYDAHAVVREGRRLQVWSADEIIRLIESNYEIVLTKQMFPGAEVVSARPKKPATFNHTADEEC